MLTHEPKASGLTFIEAELFAINQHFWVGYCCYPIRFEVSKTKNILAFFFIKKHQIFFFIKKTSNLFSQECESISLSLIENKRVIKILDRTVHSFNQIPITQIKSIHLSRACFNEREHGWKYLREEKYWIERLY